MSGQVENAEVQKRKYGNRSIEMKYGSQSIEVRKSEKKLLIGVYCLEPWSQRVTVSKRCESRVLTHQTPVSNYVT